MGLNSSTICGSNKVVDEQFQPKAILKPQPKATLKAQLTLSTSFKAPKRVSQKFKNILNEFEGRPSSSRNSKRKSILEKLFSQQKKSIDEKKQQSSKLTFLSDVRKMLESPELSGGKRLFESPIGRRRKSKSGRGILETVEYAEGIKELLIKSEQMMNNMCGDNKKKKNVSPNRAAQDGIAVTNEYLKTQPDNNLFQKVAKDQLPTLPKLKFEEEYQNFISKDVSWGKKKVSTTTEGAHISQDLKYNSPFRSPSPINGSETTALMTTDASNKRFSSKKKGGVGNMRNSREEKQEVFQIHLNKSPSGSPRSIKIPQGLIDDPIEDNPNYLHRQMSQLSSLNNPTSPKQNGGSPKNYINRKHTAASPTSKGLNSFPMLSINLMCPDERSSMMLSEVKSKHSDKILSMKEITGSSEDPIMKIIEIRRKRIQVSNSVGNKRGLNTNQQESAEGSSTFENQSTTKSPKNFHRKVIMKNKPKQIEIEPDIDIKRRQFESLSDLQKILRNNKHPIDYYFTKKEILLQYKRPNHAEVDKHMYIRNKRHAKDEV